MNSPKTDRPSRPESREVVELRELKTQQPDLASAADMQIELLSAQRRVQARVPLPSVTFDRRKPDRQQRKPILQFKDLPIDWSDFRLMIRQTADILKRFDTLDGPEYDRVQSLARDGPGGDCSTRRLNRHVSRLSVVVRPPTERGPLPSARTGS